MSSFLEGLKKLGKGLAGVVVSAFVVVGETSVLAGAIGVDAGRIIIKSDQIVDHDLHGGPIPADDVKPWSATKQVWKAFGVLWNDIYETFFR